MKSFSKIERDIRCVVLPLLYNLVTKRDFDEIPFNLLSSL